SVPLTTASKSKYVEIDVTAAMVEWLNGTQANDGIALVANSPLVATFDSKENTTTSHAPELDLVFTSGGITGVTTASGSGLMGGGTSGTLNLSLTNTCAANQVLQWNGTAWVCANLKGSGTITGVTAGTDLTGGGTSGKVTLNLDTTKVPQLSGNNSFIGNQTVSGTVTATSFFGDGTAVTNVNASSLGGILASGFATTGGINVFTGGQVIEANLQVYPSNPGDAVDTQAFGGGSGLSAISDSGDGVAGISGTGNGVYGYINGGTASGVAVYGEHDYGGVGVIGYSDTGFGDAIEGLGSGGYGVYASSNGGAAAVYGIDVSGSNVGVYGSSSGFTGVYGTSDSGEGVQGLSSTGDGVFGFSTGNAGNFLGDLNVTGKIYAGTKDFK